MTSTQPKILMGGLLFFLALATAFVASVPSYRNSVKNIFVAEQRMILAKISAQMSTVQMQIDVFKIQKNGRLSIEIYSKSEGAESSFQILNRFELPESRDGYFLLKGSATNLALTDYDNDGEIEILAPTFDDQMVARLHVFKFDPTLKKFFAVQAQQ